MSLKTWFIATRPWSLVMTFVSTCLAGIMAYSSGVFNPFFFVLTMTGLLIAHTAANMANDWYDVKDGVDENAPTAEYRPHPLLFGEVDKKSYKMVVFGLYSIGLLISVYLTIVQGYMVLVFTGLGLFFGVFYTAGPIKLKHHSMGEVSTFLAFGPFMVGGAFYAITGQFSWIPILASIPIGLLVALVVFANNLRDKDFDAEVGINTIITGVEESQGMVFYKTLLTSAYLSTLALIGIGVFSPFAIISFVSAPKGIGMAKEFSKKVPLTSDMQTAQLALHFGILLAFGELLNVVYQAIV